MSYDSTQLSRIDSQYDGSWSLWAYRSSDPLTSVTAADYITDAQPRFMRRGDTVFAVTFGDQTVNLFAVTAINSNTGAGTLTLLSGPTTEIDARMVGCRCDADGTVHGGTDDTEAFRAFIAVLAETGMPGTWFGGIRLTGESLTANSAIITPVNMTNFVLRGVSPRESYLYLDGEFDDFFLQFADRLGLWTGDVSTTFVDNNPPPPPQLFRNLYLENFSVFGQGTDIDGNSVAAQKGISFNQRHDCVLMNNVYLFNINGAALYMGRSVNGEQNGFRESRLNHVVVYRCGSTTEPAWTIDGGESASFGPNFIFANDCECSHSRGDAFVLSSANPNNGAHAINFNGFKLHGTGEGISTNIPVPWTRRALVIEGSTSNTIEFNGVTIVQSATETGDYAINLVEGLGRLALDGADGTNLGDMTAAGGLAAAFNGITSKVAAVSAGKNSSTLAWIGKTLVSPTPIARSLMYASSDRGFVVDQTTVSVTFTLRGKNGAAPISATDGTLLGTRIVTDAVGIIATVVNSADVVTEWDHIIIAMSVASTASLRLASLIFFEAVPGWPTNVSISAQITSCDGGVLIEGGGNHNIDLLEVAGITNNIVEFGPNITSTINLSLPSVAESLDLIADSSISHLVKIRDSSIGADGLSWSKFSNFALAAAQAVVTTTPVQISFFSLALDANSTYDLQICISYTTVAAADFKYSVISSASLSSIALAKSIIAPGDVAPTLSNISTLPANEAVTGGAGSGRINLQGTFVVGGSATTITIRGAQNTLDVGATQVSAGTFYQFKKLG